MPNPAGNATLRTGSPRTLLSTIAMLVLFWHLTVRLGMWYDLWRDAIRLPLAPLWLLAHGMFRHPRLSYGVLLAFIAYLTRRFSTDPNGTTRLCHWVLILAGLVPILLSEVMLWLQLGPILM